MNRKYNSSSGGFIRSLVSAIALVAVFAFVNTNTAQANTAANAKILNQVTVTFKDATGSGTGFTQTASTTVTVQLVQSQLLVTILSENIAVNVGTPAVYQDYAITATANGSDGYKITPTFSAMSNLASQSLDYAIYRWSGTELAVTNTGTQIVGATGTNTLTPVNIGGSVVIGRNGTDTLKVPFGSLNGIAAKTVVMVGTNGPYLVSGTTPGTVASIPGTEVPATITLTAYSGGSAPTITDADIGTVVAERVFLRVTVAGTITGTIGTTDGSIKHTITTTDSVGGNSSTAVYNTTTFHGTKLDISKNVANCGQDGSSCDTPAATKNGLPGDILEYTITVHNAGSGPATLVAVADAVPVYTGLVVAGGSALVSADANVFAVVTGGATTANLQVGGNGGTTDVANGKVNYVANPKSAALNPMNFYLGIGSTNSAGGTLVAGDPAPADAPTYTIKYRVKVN